jgi:sarcosine oxidase subunit beta
MKSRYSIFSLARNARNYHKDWERAWRSPEPQPEYDVVIVGAGGHGLATAYYLAKNHKLTRIAVLEKGWLGGGNTGRNTTIIRSNYLQDASMSIYELARSLYEDLSQELNFNVMFSPRGVMMLCQTEHELRAFKRTAHANRLAGLDCRMIAASEVKPIAPIINADPTCR